jgi:enterochelin esterase family protein
MSDLDHLLERARLEGTPLIDGEQVTFVWQGEEAPALLTDFSGWEIERGLQMTAVAPRLWLYTTKLPRNAFIEYAYIIDPENADSDDGRAPDPFNPQAKWNGVNAVNHYFYMPEAIPSPLVNRQRGAPQGRESRCKVEPDGLAASPKRDIFFYQPPVDEPTPLLVVWDGRDYLRQAQLPNIVNNMILAGEIAPISLAMVDNGRKNRFLEYGASDVSLSFLTEIVIPQARQELNLIDIAAQPGAYAILGASMGGLMALYAGWRLPHIFGRVLAQSGAYAIQDHEFVIYPLARYQPPPPLKVWMDVGVYDFLYDANRDMAALLQARGVDVTYEEYIGGHNYYAWRDHLPNGLRHLFGVGN